MSHIYTLAADMTNRIYLSSCVHIDFERDEDRDDSRVVVFGRKVNGSLSMLQKNIRGMFIFSYAQVSKETIRKQSTPCLSAGEHTNGERKAA